MSAHPAGTTVILIGRGSVSAELLLEAGLGDLPIVAADSGTLGLGEGIYTSAALADATHVLVGPRPTRGCLPAEIAQRGPLFISGETGARMSRLVLSSNSHSLGNSLSSSLSTDFDWPIFSYHRSHERPAPEPTSEKPSARTLRQLRRGAPDWEQRAGRRGSR